MWGLGLGMIYYTLNTAINVKHSNMFQSAEQINHFKIFDMETSKVAYLRWFLHGDKEQTRPN